MSQFKLMIVCVYITKNYGPSVRNYTITNKFMLSGYQMVP